MENKMILPFYKVDEIKMPFVISEVEDKDGNIRRGLFLIDTGSKDNLLDLKATDVIKDLAYSGNTLDIMGVGGSKIVTKEASAQIILDGKTYEDTFYVTSGLNFDMFFGPNCVFGILGSNFLRKYKLTLDFSSRCLRDSQAENRLHLKGDAFLFPMKETFDAYGIPLVGIAKENEFYFCVADSGANVSVLSQVGIAGTLEFEDTKSKGTISGIATSSEATKAVATFSLVSVDPKDEDTINCVESIENFNILPCDYILKPEEGCPPISGLIGSSFMLKNGWVLDYKRGIIYANVA